ncbi:MAG TPA: prolyl oligopeptidase family serine peptidase [Williamwhitmania sp.]|nr:prolyl oligopeptidase family serine peptidase [Williamwhitmania sp.]
MNRQNFKAHSTLPIARFLLLTAFLLLTLQLSAQQGIPIDSLGKGPEIGQFTALENGKAFIYSIKENRNENYFLVKLNGVTKCLGELTSWEQIDNGRFIGVVAKQKKEVSLINTETLKQAPIGKNGKRLIDVGKNSVIVELNSKKKKEYITFNIAHNNSLPDTFNIYSTSPDNGYLLLGNTIDSTTQFFRYSFANKSKKTIAETTGNILDLAISPNGECAAIAYTNKGRSYLLQLNLNKVGEHLDTIPSGWALATKPMLSFSSSGATLQLLLEKVDSTSLLNSSIEVWDYRDVTLASAEAKREERNLNRKFLWIAQNGKLQQVENDTLQKARQVGNSTRYYIGSVEYPYLKQRSWESGKKADYYLIDLENSSATCLKKGAMFYVNSSPSGKYLYWFDTDSCWHSYSIASKKENIITEGANDFFFNIRNDEPTWPGPFAPEGWTKNDEHIILKGYYDLWKCDPSGKEAPLCLTAGYGKEHNMQLRICEASKKRGLNEKEVVVAEGFSLSTKESGLFEIALSKSTQPRLLHGGNFKLTATKVLSNGAIAWRQETYNSYPDIFYKTPAGEVKKVTNLGAYYSKWGTGNVQLVQWFTQHGKQIQGMLFLPDTCIKPPYPLVVNLYERQSDDLHLFRRPEFSEATINIPYYTSNGFAVFIPDIVFEVGNPGESSFECVTSGLRYVFANYPQLDSARVGIQGHSWGAYQAAYLLTRTNLFKAAVAVAPVSDMVSAYGGLRRGVGNSRMFQYESGQSRIGKTLWEAPQTYINHSTVLFANRITTPLLIIANDNDGAVPWEQGIELFLALRRLNQPAWLINYKGDAHVLNKHENKVDLTQRMMTFFTYYLKGSGMPVWMKDPSFE